MNIALIAHDNKKELMVQFCTAYCGILAQQSLFRHGLRHPLGQAVAKARQGHRGPGSAPICQWLIQTHGTEEHAGDHIARQNTGGGQPGAVDQNLPHSAEKSAAEKCVKICHTPYLSVLTHTRWQMLGIDSP